jgi:hypothetical protein
LVLWGRSYDRATSCPWWQTLQECQPRLKPQGTQKRRLASVDLDVVYNNWKKRLTNLIRTYTARVRHEDLDAILDRALFPQQRLHIGIRTEFDTKGFVLPVCVVEFFAEADSIFDRVELKKNVVTRAIALNDSLLLPTMRLVVFVVVIFVVAESHDHSTYVG